MTTLKLNQVELLRRKQALIRQGQKAAFTYAVKPLPQVKRRNTPDGVAKPSGFFLKRYDKSQKRLERIMPHMRAELARLIPIEILLGHAVSVQRRHLALRPDRLIREVPTLDFPKPIKRKHSDLKCPEDWSIAERKRWAKMTDDEKRFILSGGRA